MSMKFNRQKLIAEIGDDQESAIRCIEELVEIIDEYTGDDEAAECFGGGCYEKNAKGKILNMAEGTLVGKCLENTD